jgi:starch-binding outer membrane protein, SusD/RagB family
MQRCNIILYVTVIAVLSINMGCKKLVELPPPISSIVTEQVFDTDDQANSAMAGLYYQMQFIIKCSTHMAVITFIQGE